MDMVLKDEKYAAQEPSGFDSGITRGSHNKYHKHIFYVDGCIYEVQKHDKNESIVLRLTGRGTCNIPNQKPVDCVHLAFFKDDRGDRLPEYKEHAGSIFLYIPYPYDSLENILNLIKTSKKTYVKLFYYGEDNSQCYADINGILI